MTVVSISTDEWRARQQAADELIAPQFSEESMALAFTRRHADRVRYVPKFNKWFIYNGKRWAEDERLQTYSYAREVVRETAMLASDASSTRSGQSIRIASAKSTYAIVNLASKDQRLSATVDQWDADDWLLNTPSGVIDLRTGEEREHRPEDYMQKITAVAADHNMVPVIWHEFLNRSTGEKPELQSYLQRMAGYMLTGQTRDHALFFAYGTGGNGKSVIISTLAGMLGEYHRTAPIEAFTASQQDRHPTDIAGLVGARMVSATETEQGRLWAEARIKVITGGDRISARFMRQDFFEFIPKFKLIIAGNHRPGLKSVDEAMIRRIHLIPFTVTIPPDERDPELAERLKAEWPAILAWCIEGCLEWQRIGLAPPAAVVEATRDYLQSEDVLAIWLDECCELSRDHWGLSGVLFASWRQWAQAAGEEVGTERQFSQRLQTRGLAKVRRNGGRRAYTGVRLKPAWGQPF